MSGRGSSDTKKAAEAQTRKIMAQILDIVEKHSKEPEFKALPIDTQINLVIAAMAGSLGIALHHWAESGADVRTMFEAALEYLVKGINVGQHNLSAKVSVTKLNRDPTIQ